MKAGNFNIYSYLDKLNEEAEMAEKATTKVDSLGLIIPDTNTKTYNWLKSEYQKGKTEVKVEMNIGGSKFEPGYEMQGNIKTVDNFKPGMYGAIKTDDALPAKKDVENGVKSDKDADAEKTETADKGKASTTPAQTPPADKKPAAPGAKKPETATPPKKAEGSAEAKGKTLNFDLKTKKNDKA